MRLAGISLAGEFAGPGEPGDPTGVMFLRQVRGKNDKWVKVKIYIPLLVIIRILFDIKNIFQADYLIRIGRYEPAMMYLMTTLEMEKENKNQTITLVRMHFQNMPYLLNKCNVLLQFLVLNFHFYIQTLQEALANLAKCHLLLGNWTAAKETAEKVLSVDCNHVKAIYAKAESLYNTCQFEQALMLFHRGSVNHLNRKQISFYFKNV